jgi:hypothetical protein
VAIIATSADAVKAVTSSGLDGTFQLALAPGTYEVRAELTGFSPLEQALDLGAAPCDRGLDLHLTLLARTPRTAPAAAGGSRFETVAVQTQATAAAGLEVNPPDRETAEAARDSPPKAPPKRSPSPAAWQASTAAC